MSDTVTRTGASTGASTGGTTVETRQTFCRFCHAACPLEVDVEISGGRERAVAVRGVLDDPLFEGYTCIKGRQLPDQHHAPDRLRRPLRRDADGSFAEVSSAEALDDIAARIRRIIDEHGPRAVASYTGTGAFQNGISMPAAVAFHRGIDSPSFYTSITIDQPAHLTARLRLGSWEAGWQNFRDADVLLAIGYNPLVSSYAPAGGLQGTNPFVTLRRAKARGMQLIVIDPRRSELASNADLWLQVKPGEDPTLLAGLVRVILDEDLHDREFCDRWVGQLDELRAAVAPFTPAYVAERCEVPAGDVVRAARMFAAGPRGTAGTGTGPNMAAHSTLMEHLTLTLNAICGRVNREGDTLESGNFLVPGDTRRAQVVPPSDPAPGTPHRVKGLRGMPGEMLTNVLAEEILLPGDGQVRCLVVCGGNPVVAFPDQVKTIAALRDLELLVVIDHRMTASAELAHYVLPPRLELERADVAAVMDRRYAAPYVSYTPAVLAPEGDCMSEWEVFAGIAARLGTSMPLPGGDLPLDGSADDELMLDLAFATGRMPMAEMREHRGQILHDREVRVVAPDPAATGRFAVAPPDVVAELAEVSAEQTGAEVLDGFDDGAYPFRLVSRRLKHVLNSLGRELPGLARVGTTNAAYLHPDDLAGLGAVDGDLLEITSPTGSVLAVAEGSDTVKRGVISMAHSWGGAVTDEDVRTEGSPTNRLCTVDSGWDRLNGMAIQSAIPVSVLKHTA
ncbi:MAG: molybdopterin-dependent oxidoreductase [Actinobacteria bacterium]|nr:molybdopterin-dependent oxidoreductase [Actinomycetota bacterium]